ncbi:MAG: SMP-30/gluconolactonase/LRE family protein [Microcoleaceae cyanobacterium]
MHQSIQTQAIAVLLICPSTEVLQSLKLDSLPEEFSLHLFQIPGFNTHPLSIAAEIDFCEITQKAILEARRVQAQAILYASDFSALIAAIVCETLKLPGPSLLSVVRAYCKPLARQFDPVQSIPVRVLDAALEPPTDINFPVFVKPICGSASQFSGAATTASELQTRCAEVATHYSTIWQKFARFFQTFCSNCFPTEWLSMQAPVIVEPFLPGRIINCDGYIQHGQVQVLGFVGESHNETEQRYFVPVPLSPTVEQQLIDYTAQLCQALEIDQTCFCIEYMVENEDVRLMEFNPRIASCFRSLYRQCFEVDLFQVSTQLAIGKDVLRPAELPRKSSLHFVNLYLKSSELISQAEQMLDFEMIEHLNKVSPFELVAAVHPQQPIHSLFAYANLWGKSQSIVDHWSNRLANLITRSWRTINHQTYDISIFYQEVEAVEGIVNYPDWIAWVDYQSCQLYEYIKIEDRLNIISLPFPAYTVAYHQNGQILLGGPMGLVICERSDLTDQDIKPGDFQQLWDIPINTIRADPMGRLYATEETSPKQNSGRLVKFDLDGSTQIMATGISYGNTIDFSPDGNRLYLADTTLHRVMQYDLDQDGNPTAEDQFAVFESNDGAPDGLVVDGSGNIWITTWFGGKVRGYDAQGQRIGDLLIPVQNVTSVCPFQGNLLVTTASQTWPEGEPWMSEFFIPPTVSTSPVYSVQIQNRPVPEKTAHFANFRVDH